MWWTRIEFCKFFNLTMNQVVITKDVDYSGESDEPYFLNETTEFSGNKRIKRTIEFASIQERDKAFDNYKNKQARKFIRDMRNIK